MQAETLYRGGQPVATLAGAVPVHSVAEEYDALARRLGPRGVGWDLVRQSLVRRSGRWYDALEVDRAGHREMHYFDVTSLLAPMGLAEAPPPAPGGTVTLASVMTGATVGLLAFVLRAPLWGSLLAGAGAAVTTKWAIDRA